MVLNIFLLRPSIARPDSAIDPDAGTTEYAGAADLPFFGRFFLGPEKEAEPTWFSFVNSGLIRPLPNFVQSGVSGVLVLSASNRFFAITFGRGRYLLKPGSYEEDFGLKVALNRINENDLSSIDTKTYDEFVTSSKIQVSRDARIENFGVDIARDILRAVQGKPKDGQFATRLAGADALTISRPGLQFQDLGALCAELLVAYRETTYQTNFKWVDNVKQVRDQATVARLEAALVAAILSNALGNMHLTLLDEGNRVEIAAYQFTHGGQGEFLNLELAAYIRHVVLPRRNSYDLSALKRHRLSIRLAGETEFRPHASIYESLVWETDLGGEVFAFFDGRWFKVARNYSDEVKAYWRSILRTAYPLPTALLTEDEGVYNRRASVADPQLALFDRVHLLPSSAGSPVEFCDLLSAQGQFIHVKWRYGSATFSHLFSQGSVAFETFLEDAGYRLRASQELTRIGKTAHLALLPTNQPNPALYEIVYAVLAPASAGTELLPFFSAVNLRQHGSRLRAVGVKLSLQHVIAQ